MALRTASAAVSEPSVPTTTDENIDIVSAPSTRTLPTSPARRPGRMSERRGRRG